MGLKSTLSKPFAKYIISRQKKWMFCPEETQQKVLKKIVAQAKHTQFGSAHQFEEIHDYETFKKNVPIRAYEELKTYIDQIIKGASDVFWPGKPIYFAKTSGTTSGTKYIPITKASISNHINGARDALLNYVHETGKADFIDKKMIFLSGSPVLDSTGGIPTGRLSGIVNHHVPAYLRKNQLPSYSTNTIEDWEEKLDKIIDETLPQAMSLISGIPPWVQMYFDKIIERTGKPIKDIFPDFSLLVYGGVNFKPYSAKLYESIGKKVDAIELFPASEGFFAFQDQQDEEGMLLLLNSGIFYEFIPLENYFDEAPPRLSIGQVELNKNYAMLLSSNAGLWAYNLGDTVKFVSLHPHRVIVSGRVKHFISAFGEHVIGEEVEKAIAEALKAFPEVAINEFTVAPNVNPEEGLPHHEWLISFTTAPRDLQAFSSVIDRSMCKLNTYYQDLIDGHILCPLKIRSLDPSAFVFYMKSIGKLGGQNKVPRLSNDRTIADKILQWEI